MAKKNFQNRISSSFNNLEKKPESPAIRSRDGELEIISCNRIKKNPLNTNHKPPEIITSIALSIKVLGLLESPVVYKDTDGFYMLLSGEGRLDAVNELHDTYGGYETIRCVVREKPESKEVEDTIIRTFNQERNPITLEATDDNVREMCKNARILTEKGHTQFEDLIKGTIMLKKSSISNYCRIYEDLESNWLSAFEDDDLKLKDALLLIKYTKPEQTILFQKKKSGEEFSFEKDFFDSVVLPYAENEEKKELEAVYDELNQLKKEKAKLEKELKKEENKDTTDFSRTKLKNKARREEDYKKKLEEKEEELQLVKEKLQRSQNLLPSFSDEELEKERRNQDLIYSLKAVEAQIEQAKKNITSYQEKYGEVSNEANAIIEILKNIL